MDAAEKAVEENRRLRRTMRDLVALSTLPAVWTGLAPEQIACSLADVLLHTLSLDWVYIRLAGLPGEGAIEVVRSKHRPDAAHDEAVRAAIAPLLSDRCEPPATISNPFGSGTLNIAVTRFGVGDDCGVLVAGSRNADFPTDQDRLLLGVGANQTAIVVQRRRAEQQVRQQQEWLRVTLASIGDAVIATDMQGRVTFLNGVAADLTGWTPEDAQGQPLEKVFPIRNEHTRMPVENPVEKVLREGVVVGLANHTVLVARDGSERPIDDSAAPIRDLSGKMIGVVLIFRNVAEQRKAEQELRASEARKSAILETALDCVITMDHHGKVVEFNPAAERTFGYSRGEVIGRELADLIIPPSLRERHHRGMAHYLATGEGPVLGRRLELPALRADGSEFPVELAITRISTEGPPLFTAYLRDIGERTRSEQYRNARLAVTQALSQAASVDEAASGVLQAVCENLGWDVGFFWAVNDQQDALVCRKSWHRSDVPATHFESASCDRTFARGEGLPGHVWSTGESKWLLDVTLAPNFPRAATAADEGLHSAIACPVSVGEKRLGVIEFFTQRIREPDASLLELIGTIVGQVGQFIERKRAEEKLRRNERELADFFENATVGLHWVGADGTILRANRAELELLGFAPEEYIGHNICEFHVDDDVICDILQRLKAKEKLQDYPARMRCKDGSIKDVLIHSSVLFEEGRFVHTRCFTRDVTEQRKSEVALRQSEERFRQLAENIEDVFWMADPRTPQVLFVSPAYERVWGRSRQSLYEQPRSFLAAVHLDDRQRAFDTLERQARGEATAEEYRVVRPDGSVRWVLDRAFPIRDASGEVYRVAGIAEDITERKHAEELSRFLADASTTLATVVDYKSTLQKVVGLAVPTFADWCAVDLVEADGSLRRLAVVHVDDDKVRLASELHQKYPPDANASHGAYRVLRTGEPEFVNEIGDDVLVDVAQDDEHLRILRSLGLKSFMCVPLRTRKNTLGVLTFVYAESGRRYEPRDLTLAVELARRAAIAIENAGLYHELKEADRRKDEFLATLAHELRNPLAPIRNGLEVLRLTGPHDGIIGEARSMMERQLNQMVRLVDDLLDVSRITRNKLDLKKQRIELATVVQSAVETSHPLIKEAGHELSVTLPAVAVHLDGDVTRLAQVFSNLLNNAAKYTEAGGRVSLTAEVLGDHVAVRVRDNGLGIPAEALPHLFQMFSQVDRNMERAQGGLGIGLTLVRRLVELHGGTVEAHSDGPGKGSEFVVRLPTLSPISVSSPTHPTTEDESGGASMKRRILIVDDNHDSALSLAMMLKLMGNETRTAHDGLAAIGAASAFRPDIILLDIGLPKLNGYDACRRIREQPWSDSIMIVALTGWGQDEDRRRSVEAGFDHHLVKPVEVSSLHDLLARHQHVR